MSNDQVNGDSTSPGRRGIGGRVIAMALLVFVGLYMLSDIPGEIGRWKMAVARDQHEDEQFEQALKTAHEAQQWDPDNVGVASTRIEWLIEQGEDEAALQAMTELLQAVEGQRKAEIGLLLNRAEQLQYMDRHREAIADADRAVEYEKAFGRTMGDEFANAQAMNARAYTVARAAAAGRASDAQIGNAITQMQEVLAYLDKQRPALAHGQSHDKQMDFQLAEVMFLDTYAYLRLFAGEEYLPGVLRDFNRCVQSCDQLIALALDLSEDRGRQAEMKRFAYRVAANKAVIIHHRGETYALLGNKRAALEDKEIARQLGYGKENRNW